jgi:voltage-gated sodium channel
MSIFEKWGRLVESTSMQRVVMWLIVTNAVLLGLETVPAIMNEFGPIILMLDQAILAVFVFELLGKFAYRRLAFFRDGWNWFDLIVVGIALVPAAGPLAVLRTLRVLRLLRLLSVVPSMRAVIEGLFRALPGMGSIAALISLIFYVGSVLATNLYGRDFQDWFGKIGASMYSLFQIMTLESWSMGIVRPVMEVHPWAWAFFVPFILVTTFAVLNLFEVSHALPAKQRAVSKNWDLRNGRRSVILSSQFGAGGAR